MGIQKLFFAGSGGQGVLLMGQMIATAAMQENKSSTFFPSYGPEMRGGTANCTVVVSDKTVSCPLIYEADCIVAMNLPSLIKFEQMVKPGGVLLLNTSIITQKAERKDITVLEIPANDLAHDLGNAKVANMIVLGALVRATNVVTDASIEKIIRDSFGKKKAEMIDINLKAYNYWQK